MTASQQFNAWYRAARPRTLTATYVPLGVAAAVALRDGVFEPLK
ncbi:MAG: 1,4-dihydroxy-2-naphthoate octaprenyltransferase, partial [Phototrophicales bacterium]